MKEQIEQLKKVLFLDIDGVLDSVKSDGWVDPEAASALKAIIDSQRPAIVISSNWRSMGLEWLREKWEEWHLPSSPYGITPDVNISEAIELLPGAKDIVVGKGVAIKKWLLQHLECSSYAIVDDWPVALPEQADRFVMTDSFVGLTSEDASKVIAILQR